MQFNSCSACAQTRSIAMVTQIMGLFVDFWHGATSRLVQGSKGINRPFASRDSLTVGTIDRPRLSICMARVSEPGDEMRRVLIRHLKVGVFIYRASIDPFWDHPLA